MPIHLSSFCESDVINKSGKNVDRQRCTSGKFHFLIATERRTKVHIFVASSGKRTRMHISFLKLYIYSVLSTVRICEMFYYFFDEKVNLLIVRNIKQYDSSLQQKFQDIGFLARVNLVYRTRKYEKA